MINLFTFSLTPVQLMLLTVVALLVGMSKTGVHGAGLVAVPLLATVFGGQFSTGIMLPMLCLADVAGVWYYHRHASWVHLKKLFPWAAVGTLVGTWVGGYIDDGTFRIIMAIIIFLSLMVMLWMERGHKEAVPHYYWFAALCGMAGGFTSMVGNLGGSVMAIYFLAMRLPKNSFIGTTAWFFMIINWFKIPFHVIAWKTISWNTLWLDLSLLPVILLGAFLGIVIVRSLSELVYRWFIVGMTLVAATLMVLP